jgi:hypothetical protein
MGITESTEVTGLSVLIARHIRASCNNRVERPFVPTYTREEDTS